MLCPARQSRLSFMPELRHDNGSDARAVRALLRVDVHVRRLGADAGHDAEVREEVDDRFGVERGRVGDPRGLDGLVLTADARDQPREAVDLANMMLTLSLRTSPDEVYRAACDQFTEDDIAEALAATRGVTIPSELKHAINDDPRDVLGELRRVAPEREP